MKVGMKVGNKESWPQWYSRMLSLGKPGGNRIDRGETLGAIVRSARGVLVNEQSLDMRSGDISALHGHMGRVIRCGLLLLLLCLPYSPS
jgi:hypothetical protein